LWTRSILLTGAYAVRVDAATLDFGNDRKESGGQQHGSR
jgi:hypothetical protein